MRASLTHDMNAWDQSIISIRCLNTNSIVRDNIAIIYLIDTRPDFLDEAGRRYSRTI